MFTNVNEYLLLLKTDKNYLRIQIQVGKLSVTDGSHCLTVHGEVHLSTITLDGDVVPVQVVKKASSSQCSSTIYFVYNTTSWEIKGKINCSKHQENVKSLRCYCVPCNKIPTKYLL